MSMMKCEVMLINRGRTKHYKRGCKFDANLIKFKTFKKEHTYKIPDNCKYLELEKGRGTRPLWLVDELTHMALGWSFEKPTNGKGYLKISSVSDSTTQAKLNVMIKVSFWEALGKKLKISLMTTILYLGAGYGLFRFAEYLVTLIFTQKG